MRAETVGGDMPRQAEPVAPHYLGEMVSMIALVTN
jgi:hypothetical protein